MTQKEFLIDVSNWNNHLPLLWLALEATKGCLLPVMEFGAGTGSTPYLREYCKHNNREFLSYDYNKEWAEKMGSVHIEDWESADIYQACSVILVDESPGENRHKTMERIKYLADVVVIHDSEAAATGYMLDKIWHFYKHRVNLSNGTGAEATAVSNKFDVTIWDGLELCGYKISK